MVTQEQCGTDTLHTIHDYAIFYCGEGKNSQWSRRIRTPRIYLVLSQGYSDYFKKNLCQKSLSPSSQSRNLCDENEGLIDLWILLYSRYFLAKTERARLISHDYRQKCTSSITFEITFFGLWKKVVKWVTCRQKNRTLEYIYFAHFNKYASIL
jgi:hypothetical protein